MAEARVPSKRNPLVERRVEARAPARDPGYQLVREAFPTPDVAGPEIGLFLEAEPDLGLEPAILVHAVVVALGARIELRLDALEPLAVVEVEHPVGPATRRAVVVLGHKTVF